MPNSKGRAKARAKAKAKATVNQKNNEAEAKVEGVSGSEGKGNSVLAVRLYHSFR